MGNPQTLIWAKIREKNGSEILRTFWRKNRKTKWFKGLSGYPIGRKNNQKVRIQPKGLPLGLVPSGPSGPQLNAIHNPLAKLGISQAPQMLVMGQQDHLGFL